MFDDQWPPSHPLFPQSGPGTSAQTHNNHTPVLQNLTWNARTAGGTVDSVVVVTPVERVGVAAGLLVAQESSFLSNAVTSTVKVFSSWSSCS